MVPALRTIGVALKTVGWSGAPIIVCSVFSGARMKPCLRRTCCLLPLMSCGV